VKKHCLMLVFCLICFPFSTFAEEAQKPSEMPKPMSESPSEEAKKRAHKKVEVRKKELLKKLKNQDSPEAIGNAKARVQIDRTESNRQDYLDQEKKKTAKKDCVAPDCPEISE